MANVKTHAIYALPLPSSSNPTQHSSKRKRKQSEGRSVEENDKTDSDTAYSAVITPEERAQRQLAGHRLDRSPPHAPFPHAPELPSPCELSETISHTEDYAASIDSRLPSSLRNTHLAVMVAILHQSLEQKEYARAAKAIAVVMRTEISGKSIDIRHAGFWNIGAEILLRSDTVDGSIARAGFDKTKTFYDKLALQHPWHRSWSKTLNAQDFKLAMFNLWVYAIWMESRRVQEQYVDEDEIIASNDQRLQAKRWELGEADALSKELDSLMATVPFIDQLELIRLRAMVAIWTADLVDEIDLLSVDAVSEDNYLDQVLYNTSSNNADHHRHSILGRSNDKATACRTLAQRLFAKLGIDKDVTLSQEEQDYNADSVC